MPIMMGRAMLWTGLALLAWNAAAVVHAEAPAGDGQGGSAALLDAVLVPDYRLPGPAGGSLPERPPSPVTPPDDGTFPLPPLWLAGMEPTQRWEPAVPASALETGPFSVEMWLVDHVNQPVGITLAWRGTDGQPIWLLGYHDGGGFWSAFADGRRAQHLSVERSASAAPFGKYWRHLAISCADREVSFWFNGRIVGRAPLPEPRERAGRRLEVAAYLANEPYMTLPNLLHRLRIRRAPLSDEAVRRGLHEWADRVDRGILYPDRFHFTAGPVLGWVGEASARVVFETDRESAARVEWGTTLNFSHKVELSEKQRIHRAALEDLQPRTLYYYRVRAVEPGGGAIESGVGTFQTAGPPGRPTTFAVIGDTEGRPHINARISGLVWGERPEFIVILGDLTDGGMRGHKFEWTHEYFIGMSALQSRVPVFPVPGNGEGDLYWYQRYFPTPTDQDNDPGFYSFRWGDAEFFMLDSNRREIDFQPGGRQYEWLDRRLAASQARWRFVCHHHALLSSDDDDYGEVYAGEPSTLGDPAVQRMAGLYEKHHVDIVFQAHLHTYERTWPVRGGRVDEGGVVYVKSGGAGGNLEDFLPVRSWFTARTFRGHHYCLISLAGDTLQLKMLDVDGRLRDFCERRKPGPQPAPDHADTVSSGSAAPAVVPATP